MPQIVTVYMSGRCSPCTKQSLKTASSRSADKAQRVTSLGGWIGYLVLELAGLADSTAGEKASGPSSATLPAEVGKSWCSQEGRQGLVEEQEGLVIRWLCVAGILDRVRSAPDSVSSCPAESFFTPTESSFLPAEPSLPLVESPVQNTFHTPVGLLLHSAVVWQHVFHENIGKKDTDHMTWHVTWNGSSLRRRKHNILVICSPS